MSARPGTGRRSLPRLAAAVLAVLAVLGSVLAAPRPALAAAYTLRTTAEYRVSPRAGEIEVRITAWLTNTTPDPDGQFSVFDEARLAIHDEAREVRAGDRDGELDVAVAVEDEVNVATIDLREGVRYEETAKFTLVYVLPDSDDPQLRVRPSLVVFPAWSFGTSGRVSVELPAGYDVLVDGDPLSDQDGKLESGAIDDPTRWLALVTATGPVEHRSFDAAVPLTGGTADLEVRALSDDEAWGERTLDLVTRALPLLEEEIGLPYPRLGRLVVTEVISGDTSGFAEGEATGGTEIAVAFDQPAFTILHQVAHVWLSPGFVEDRWLREGLASAIAARVAQRLEVATPYDPAARSEELADAAFPLDDWPAESAPEAQGYGIAASWEFVEMIEDTVGRDALRTVLLRVAASMGPYAPATIDPTPAPDGLASPAAPLTSRSFLDHLETVSGRDLAAEFAARVLGEADAALLPLRAGARAGFDQLVARANGWGAPDPVRAAMTAWNFDDALRQIGAASTWLDARDALLDKMRAVGLSAPDRLQQAYRSFGGGDEATAELEAMDAIVGEYVDTAAGVNRERSFLERVGLLGGPDPATELQLAHGRFADGDLLGAHAALGEAQRMVLAAETAGIVRIASALFVAVLVLVLAVVLVRRRTSYTARP